MATAREFLESSKIKSQRDALSNAAIAAEEATKAILGASGISHYPLPVIKKLKAAALDTKTAYLNFSAGLAGDLSTEGVESLKATAGNAKTLIQALDKHEALISNHQALIGANLAMALSAFFAVLSPFTATAQRYAKVAKNLAAIKAELEKAQKNIKNAQVQAVINGAVGALGALISPATALGRFGLVVTTASFGAIINECLGSKGVGPAGATLTAVQGTLKTTDVLSKPVGSVVGKVFRSARAILDLRELQHAQKMAKDIEKRMKATEKDLTAAQAAYAKQIGGIRSAVKAASAAHKKALAGVGKHKSQAPKRMALVKALEAWKPA